MCVAVGRLQGLVECVLAATRASSIKEKPLGQSGGQHESHMVRDMHPINASPCKSELVLLGCQSQKAKLSECVEFYSNNFQYLEYKSRSCFVHQLHK